MSNLKSYAGSAVIGGTIGLVSSSMGLAVWQSVVLTVGLLFGIFLLIDSRIEERP